jgi:predicted Zn-dependent protease
MVVSRGQSGVAFWKHVALWALALALSALPLRAQRGGGGSVGSRGSTGGMPSGNSGVAPSQPGVQPGVQPNMGSELPPLTTQPLPKPVIIEDETCLPWDLADVRGATVSAIRLGVPSKARNEYSKACGAFKKKELPAAEQHVRGAIQRYSNYVAAWVMLGQVLQDEQKMNEARDACSQALSVDATYLPPYLCLAGLLERQNQWDGLLALSDRFAGLNLVGDRYAYYYRAQAYFHTYKWPEAQKNASKAIAIDEEHHLPGLYFLLAQIYGQQGDVVDAAAQVRQFLKLSNSQQDKDAARQYLSELQSQQPTK